MRVVSERIKSIRWNIIEILGENSKIDVGSINCSFILFNPFVACSRPSVSGSVERRASEEKNEGDPPLPRSLAPSFVFARRWFRSLPPIERLEQANPFDV